MAKPAKPKSTQKLKTKPSLFSWATASIYKQTLYFSLGQSDEELRKSLKKHVKNITPEIIDDILEETAQKSFRHMGLFVSNPMFIIRIYDKIDLTDADYHAILAHEILHATFELLRSRGMEYSESSEEAYTYLQDFFTGELYQALLQK